jgi:NADP-dependent 3-hydroxy acid dehydrogenase YdfG
MIAATVKMYNRVDILFNNAGIERSFGESMAITKKKIGIASLRLT